MTDNKKSDISALAEKPIGRLLWEYSAPAVIGMLVMSIYNIIDRVYIGRGVGVEAISGLAITFPVMNLSAALGVLIGAGAAARTSILLGAGDKSGAERVLGNSLVLTVLIGIAYITCFAVFLDPILYAFGASDVTIGPAREFMQWILPGMLVINICFSFNNIMRASGYPIRAMFTMIIGAVLNIAIGPIFIFALDLGIKGAAIATDISMLVSASFVMWHFFRKKSEVHFTSGIYGLKPRVVWNIVNIGLAPSLVNAASCLINIFVNRSLKDYGSDIDVGAVSIFITYTSLLTSIVVGIGLGMQPIVGYNFGAGKPDRLKKAFYLAALIGTALCTAGSIFGLAFPGWIAYAFTDDAGLTAVIVNGFKHALLLFWVVGFQIISTSFFQSIGQWGQSIVLSLSRQVLFMLPLLFILPKWLGINGVWLSFPVSDGLATIVTAALVIWQIHSINRAIKAKSHTI